MNNSKITSIITRMQNVLDGKIWIYTTIDSHIHNIDDKRAFKRPLNNVHAIAEIIAHLTHWKIRALQNFGENVTNKVYTNDWMNLEDLRKIGWGELQKDFEQSHIDLIAFLKIQDDELLKRKYFDQDYKEEFDVQFLLEGIIQHDLYHLGQIGMIKKLAKSHTS